jgi:DNA-binding response OmpR family regulator
MTTILIVDDQTCVRQLLFEELVDEGYEVEGVGDAESARARLRSSRPDLVLLDLYLDGPDGWEVLREAKRAHPLLPVIILTAYDSFEDDPRLSRADGYIVKSFDLTELKAKIAEVLDGRSDHSAEVEATPHFRRLRVAV